MFISCTHTVSVVGIYGHKHVTTFGMPNKQQECQDRST